MEVFKKENIILNVTIEEKEKLLREIARNICRLGYSREELKIFSGLMDREKEFETSLGDGFAIPHTKSEFVENPGVLLVKTKNEIRWSKEESANVFLVLFTPLESAGNTHLKMLASLSRKLINEEFKTMLHESDDVDVLYEKINNALAN